MFQWANYNVLHLVRGLVPKLIKGLRTKLESITRKIPLKLVSYQVWGSVVRLQPYRRLFRNRKNLGRLYGFGGSHLTIGAICMEFGRPLSRSQPGYYAMKKCPNLLNLSFSRCGSFLRMTQFDQSVN